MYHCQSVRYFMKCLQSSLTCDDTQILGLPLRPTLLRRPIIYDGGRNNIYKVNKAPRRCICGVRTRQSHSHQHDNWNSLLNKCAVLCFYVTQGALTENLVLFEVGVTVQLHYALRLHASNCVHQKRSSMTLATWKTDNSWQVEISRVKWSNFRAMYRSFQTSLDSNSGEV